MSASGDAVRHRRRVGGYVLCQGGLKHHRLHVMSAGGHFLRDPCLATVHREIAVIARVVEKRVARQPQRRVEIAHHLGLAGRIRKRIRHLVGFTLQRLRLLFRPQIFEVVLIVGFVDAGLDKAAREPLNQRGILAALGVRLGLHGFGLGLLGGKAIGGLGGLGGDPLRQGHFGHYGLRVAAAAADFDRDPRLPLGSGEIAIIARIVNKRVPGLRQGVMQIGHDLRLVCRTGRPVVVSVVEFAFDALAFFLRSDVT